jgi:hypothetical protein
MVTLTAGTPNLLRGGGDGCSGGGSGGRGGSGGGVK